MFYGFYLKLGIPLTFSESRTTTYIRSLRNSQQYKSADKVCSTGICTRNPQKLCIWNPLTFWNMFKVLFLESRKIKTQNCAPIQCTVWPRNAVKAFRKLNKTTRACIFHLFLRHLNPKIAFKDQNAENLNVQYKLYKNFRQKLLDVMKNLRGFKFTCFF